MTNVKLELINKIKQNNVVIFVGAGLSINAGYPNWNNLVENILDGISSKENKSEALKSALKEDILSPIEVLNKISLFREESISILESQIRNHQSNPLPVHYQLGKISNQIITTNYDSLIEKALPDYEMISYSNEFKVAKLSNYEKYIFKIHGDIQEPNKCILFPEEYDNLYVKSDKSSTFELKKIISDKSLLFIGFSLSDPYIKYVFDFIDTLYSGFNPDHYVITTDKSKQWPKKVNPINLDNYTDLESLLAEFIKGKEAAVQLQVDIKKEIETESKTDIFKVSPSSDYDSPPNNKFWVGREREIENINLGIFKIVFITGIGGQGKSALAAHYIRTNFDTNTYEFADWRDFKEEANRFQTKLISIIKRLSPDTEISFEDLSNTELVDTFFYVLKDRKIIFVFDNIDNYIDLESFIPSGSFGYFYEQIVAKNHKSKFIFTCRPFIREAVVDFFQIKLTGISEDECIELFGYYNIGVSKENLIQLANRAHKLTKGHPLWLNLIAGQAIRGVKTVNEFMTEIEGKTSFKEDNFSSILSEKILSAVWKSLNDKQKNVVRGIAETVRPETENNLKIILDSEINSNQFYKAIRTLKNLNFVETLKEGEIELHPLVKEFVLTKYPRTERIKFITLFVKYYDQFIYVLKPRLNSKLSLQEFQNWTLKIELQINQGEFKHALVALEEVCHSIVSAGYSEEYLRVAYKLYNDIPWEKAISTEYPYFHSQFNYLTTILVQMGNFIVAETLLDKYKRLIPGKSVHYLSYCSEKVYFYWYQEMFEEAIQIGEEGVELLEESSLADTYNLKHNLALAYRDSKIQKNIHKALQFFSNEEDIEELQSAFKFNKELGGTYYGNVGKCLEFLGNHPQAIKCYYFSLKLLMSENHLNAIINTGYASSWIASILQENDKEDDALYFLKYAKNCWDKTSPPRSVKISEQWELNTVSEVTKNRINEMSEWKVKDYCSTFIANEIF